jgi:predicted aspartyl protease
MGELYTAVWLKGSTTRAELTRRPPLVNLRALIDTGANRTIISRRVARRLGIRGTRQTGSVRTGSGYVETPIGFAFVRAAGCKVEPLAVAISDTLADHAGVEVILGHDYMQAAKMKLDMESLSLQCPRPEAQENPRGRLDRPHSAGPRRTARGR